MEGSGSGFVQIITDPDADPRRPKNIRILRIRIRNTGRNIAFVDVRVEKEPVLWQANGPRRQQQRRRPPPPAPGQAGTDPARHRSPHPKIVKMG
jgi:hypothetical protein